METIGLIAAMQLESSALLRCSKLWKRFSVGPYRGYQSQLINRKCVLITCGMGLKRAGAAARFLVDEIHPQLLISFGIAGATNPKLQIGDVVIASSAFLLEKGLPRLLHTLPALSESAWMAASGAVERIGRKMVIGTTITTRGAQVNLQDSVEMPHPVLEMETAGIVDVSKEMGVPFLSIRSISDGPQSPIPIDLEAALDKNDNFQIGKLLQLVVRDPKIIFRSRQIIKNSRLAADHAAFAVSAVLSQPMPILHSKGTPGGDNNVK